MKNKVILIFIYTLLLLSLAVLPFGPLAPLVKADTYLPHAPIIIENIATTAENPLIIEGYEISDPDGPGIQVREVDYVVIRNNYLHDCGVNHALSIKAQIEAGVGDARLSAMNEPFETGGILVFEAKHVEIYGNHVINNDFGIYVWGHRIRAENVKIFDNVVRDSYRSYFVKVYQGDNIDIYGNTITDNGLSLFMDNEAMDVAFSQGEDFPDGRTQGISLHSCSHARIHDNTVINSLSDGIGVINGELDFAEDIEIYGNQVLRNSEQGIWLVGVRNGSVHDNVINENHSREDVTGGSSGLYFDGDVIGFSVYGNEMAYNDMFGITVSASSENEFYRNDIHHNGDGGVCFTDTPYRPLGVSRNVKVTNNNIHDNRMSAFRVWTDVLENITIEGNTLVRNGGQPIHYEMYEDYDVTAHPDDWVYDGVSSGLETLNADVLAQIIIGENIIDGLPVIGTLDPVITPPAETSVPPGTVDNLPSVKPADKTPGNPDKTDIENETPGNTLPAGQENVHDWVEKIVLPAAVAVGAVIVIIIIVMRKRRD